MAGFSCLRDELARGPLVLAFFKVSCPTCQYAFPFLERLDRAYGHKGVRIIGVSQNEPKHTADFAKEFGVTFPVLLDETGLLSRVERLRPDQCPDRFLDRPGWRDRTLQRWLVEGRFHPDQPQDG